MIYTLKYANTTATVDELGGELLSYKSADGTDYVWTGDEKYWPKHTPFLFPIVGALIDDTIDINGKNFNMTKHGFARNMPWKAVEIKENSIAMELVANEETLAQFPFKFKFYAEHVLNEKGFTTTFKVVNNDENTMCFCVGGHPGFCCPLFEGEEFSDYELVFEKSENPNPLYCDEKSILQGARTGDVLVNNNTVLPLDYSIFDIDAIIFDDIKSRKITLRHKDKKHGLIFTYENLNHMGIWTPPGKKAPFVCLEPWKGLPAWGNETGKFQDKTDCVNLEPNEIFTASYTVEII